MITPPTPQGYTRASQHPRGVRVEGSDAITDKFFIDESDFEIGDLQRLEDLSWNGLVVNNVQWEVDQSKCQVYVTLSYGQPDSSGLTRSRDGRPEFTAEGTGNEIPIDKRKADGSLLFSGYLTNHNHMLGAVEGSAVPAWWATATDTTTSSEDYRWIKSGDSLPSGWVILKDMTRNIESVISGSYVVVEVRKYTNYNQAIAQIRVPGTKRAPERTFGQTGEWLVMPGGGVAYDGKRWVVTTRYQNAEEWDPIYYAES